MGKVLKYKGYRASVEYSDEDRCFIGRVLGIRDIIGFNGDGIEELESMFHEAIDSYLQNCAADGKSPDREYKGSFNVRVTPESHCAAACRAQELGMSLNQFVADAIREKLDRTTVTYKIPEPKYVVSEEKVVYGLPAARDDAAVLEEAAQIIRKYQEDGARCR